MKKYFLILILPVLLSFSPNKDLLIGKWKLIEVYMKQSNEVQTEKELGDLFVQVNPDGTFESIFPGQRSNGTWQRKTSKLITTVGGNTTLFTILTLSKKNLIVVDENDSRYTYIRVQ